MQMDVEDGNWEQSVVLPEPKRTRLESGFYSSGHSSQNSLLLTHHPSQYTPVPAFTGPAVYRPSPREPVVKRDQSAEPVHIHSNPAYPPSSQPLQQPNIPFYGCHGSEPAAVIPEGIDLSYNYRQEPEPTLRKKAPRVSQACDACRAAKARCDDPKPCSSCKERNLECTWKPPNPRDDVQAKILEMMRTILGKVDSIEEYLRIDPRFVSDLTSEEGKEEDKELHTPSTAPDQVHNFICREPLEEEEVGKALLPGDPAIPVGHTTGATRLLLWPAVEKFISEKLKGKENFIEYANIMESEHGLRIRCRGPGSGTDHSSDVTSPPRSGLVYGQIDGLASPNYSGGVVRLPDKQNSRAEPDERLELDEYTVNRLVDSYLNHMHILHPVLDPAELHAHAKNFIKTLPPYPKTPATNIEPPRFINSEEEPHWGKRTHSTPVSTTELPKVTVPRSIENAVLLLVLALGKICEHRTKIPVLPDYESASSGSPHVQSGYPSSMLDSLVASSQSSGLPSPKEGDRNRSTLRRQYSYVKPQKILPSRNLDAIPGLVYATFATDILGIEIGENTLHHVYANILACLYFGQLARPSYSHRFISIASIGLQVILRPKLDRLRKYKPDPEKLRHKPEKVPLKDNPLVFAFWTCLQLESDILAELDLPHSGITTLALHMPWPNLEAAKAVGKLTAVQAESYQAQLYLRNHLNKIYQTLYGVGPMGKPLEEDYILPHTNVQSNFPVIEAMVESIPSMSKVAPSMMWEETDPPASDILSARLRAKYYGTEVITYRPFLKMVMNRLSQVTEKTDSTHNTYMPVESIPTNILKYAKLCIKALENSTRAFHGMEDGRLIVTNVWGTAHSQWGNVILLQAAYQDPLLRDSIDNDNLRKLVLKTLSFLKEVADQASALMTDIEILELAAQKMGFLSERYSGPSSSVPS